MASPEERQDLLNRLDREILASPWFLAKAKSEVFPEPLQTMPYILRASALDESLEPFFLGRALYHLAQRRGFWSNRKRAARKDEDEGKVRKALASSALKWRQRKLARSGNTSRSFPRHNGAFAGRNAGRARGMYEEEFEHIWKAQARHHATVLTPELKKELHDAIFFQRRPRFDRKNTIGECELERGERRAPKYLLTSQRFRLLQTVNNLRLLPPGEAERELTPCDREKVLSKLELQERTDIQTDPGNSSSFPMITFLKVRPSVRTE